MVRDGVRTEGILTHLLCSAVPTENGYVLTENGYEGTRVHEVRKFRVQRFQSAQW